MKTILSCILLWFIGLSVQSQSLTVKKVIITEYHTWYIASDNNVYSFLGGNAKPIAFPIGGRSAVDGAGGFNVFRVLDDQGYIWTSLTDLTNHTVRQDTDTSGSPFNGNTSVYAYENTVMTIKSDGSVWYFGDDTFHLFHNTGGLNMRPTQLSPAGMAFKKVAMGGARIVGLTTAGQVVEWTYGGSRTPAQKTIPLPAIDIFASHANYAGCLIPTSAGATSGYPYVWGSSFGCWGGSAALTQPASMQSLWNISAPVQVVDLNWNTTHYIDVQGRLFGMGFNVQGEVGNGQEFVNKYTYPTFPSYGWDFGDGEYPVNKPVQIAPGIQFSQLFSNNWFSFYKYALDVNGNLYAWGRGKSLCLGNGIQNMQDADHPNATDVLVPTLVHPLTAMIQGYNFTAPSISAGPNQTVTSSTVTLTGTAQALQMVKNTTKSANGIDTWGYNIVSYQWTKVSGNGGTITSPGSATTTVTGLTNGVYVFNLVATDNNTGTQSANVTITVSSVVNNQPPTTPPTVPPTDTTPTVPPPPTVPPKGTAKAIPGSFEAESYDLSYNVNTQPTTDANGGLNVDYITSGSWMKYNVTVATAGVYTVSFRVATSNSGSRFQLLDQNGNKLTDITLSPTGGYQNWQTVTATVTLAAGAQTLEVYSSASPYWNLNWISFASGSGGGSGTGTSTPKAIPGTFEAENFDNMSGVATEATTDVGGGLDVGWIDQGDWMDYTVNVATTGMYTLYFRVASPNNGASFAVQDGKGNIYTTVAVPNTGGFQNWTDVSAVVNLNAGSQTLRLTSTSTSEWNLNWIQGIAGNMAGAVLIPGTIQAENFNNMHGVATETTTDAGGGQDVGWIDQWDWMDYTVYANSAGTYTVSFRVATPNTGATFALQDGQGNIYSMVTVPNTGGFQKWTTVSTTVKLPAGVQTLRITSTATAGWNMNWISVTNPAQGAAVTTNEVIGQAATMSIAAADLAPALSVYPNPARDQFTLDLKNVPTGKMRIQILDASGRVFSTRESENSLSESRTTLSIGNLPSGIYLIRVQIGNWVRTEKMQKIN
jgi:hypothetical protein